MPWRLLLQSVRVGTEGHTWGNEVRVDFPTRAEMIMTLLVQLCRDRRWWRVWMVLEGIYISLEL